MWELNIPKSYGTPRSVTGIALPLPVPKNHLIPFTHCRKGLLCPKSIRVARSCVFVWSNNNITHKLHQKVQILHYTLAVFTVCLSVCVRFFLPFGIGTAVHANQPFDPSTLAQYVQIPDRCSPVNRRFTSSVTSASYSGNVAVESYQCSLFFITFRNFSSKIGKIICPTMKAKQIQKFLSLTNGLLIEDISCNQLTSVNGVNIRH
jgi:hypothetical protein